LLTRRGNEGCLPLRGHIVAGDADADRDDACGR